MLILSNIFVRCCELCESVRESEKSINNSIAMMSTYVPSMLPSQYFNFFMRSFYYFEGEIKMQNVAP